MINVETPEDIYKIPLYTLFLNIEKSNYPLEYIKYVSRYRFEFFITYFFQEYLLEQFSPMHQSMFVTEEANYKEQLYEKQEFKERKTYKDALAAPRGHAKSTMITLFKPLWCILQDPPLEQYVVILSNTHDQANDRLRDIKKEIEKNILIKMVYGDLEGEPWSEKKIVLKNGVRLQTGSAESSIRGAREAWARPSLVILDDIENEKNVVTEGQRTHMKNWFNKEVMKLGAKYTNFSFVGTILHNESLLRVTLNNPLWKSKIYKSLIKEPTNKKLWDEWKKILTNAGNKERKQSADDFYAKHKKEMNDGVVLLWEEHESIKSLQEMRIAEGEHAFQTEKQNNPIDPESQIFDPHNDWLYFTELNMGAYTFLQEEESQTLIPLHECVITAWLDPSTGATAGDPDYAAIAVVAQYENFQFWVDGWMKKCSTDEQMEQVFVVAEKWNNLGFPITTFGIEANNFQKLFIESIQRIRNEKQKNGQFYKVYPQGKHQQANKQNRILALQPKFKNGWIKVSRNIPVDLIVQFESFQIGKFKVHDDMPDALEGAVKLSEKSLVFSQYT